MRSMLLSSWPFLLPILLLSVIAFAIIIERSLYFFRLRRRKDPALVLEEQAETYRREHPQSGPEALQSFLEAESIHWMQHIERSVSHLSTIANIATLLGLFGTVTGMIASFSVIRDTASTSPAMLAGGISQALVTTAFGLGTAIPSMFAFHLFSKAADNHADRMELTIRRILQEQRH